MVGLRAEWLAAVVVIGALAGCAGSNEGPLDPYVYEDKYGTGAPFDTIASVGWEPGYSYNYTFSTDGTRRETLDGKTTDSPIRQGPFSAGAFRVSKLYDEPPGGSRVVSDSQNLDCLWSPSLALLPPATYPTPNGDSLSYYVPSDTMTLGAPGRCAYPLPTIRFPLVDGDSWTTEYNTERDDTPGPTFIHSEVRGLVSIDLPTGNVAAVRIHHSAIQAFDSFERWEGYRVTDWRMARDYDVFFAPSLHSIVRIDYNEAYQSTVDTTSNGKPFNSKISWSGTSHLVLSTVSLEVRPPDEATRATPPSSGVNAGREETSLQVASDRHTDQADTQKPFHITATLTGPVDVRGLHLAILDSKEQEVAFVDGKDSLDWTPTAIGRYHARGTVNDDYGRPLAHEVSLLVDFVRDLTFSCPVVVTVAIVTCEAILLPVHFDMSALTILATRQDTVHRDAVLGALPPGSQVVNLEAPDGHVASADISGFPSSYIVLTGTDGHDTSGPWTLTYDQVAGVASTALVGIYITPSAPPHDDPGPSSYPAE